MTFTCAAALFIYISSLCDGQIHDQSASDTEARYLPWCILVTNKNFTVKKGSHGRVNYHWQYIGLYVRPPCAHCFFSIALDMTTLSANSTLSPDEAALVQSLGTGILYDALIMMVESMLYGALLVLTCLQYMVSMEILNISLFSGVYGSCICATEAAVVRRLSACVTSLLAVLRLITGHRPLVILDLVPKLEWPCSWSPS